MLSDLHGRSPRKILEDISPDRAIFLGDYDEPQLLEEILDLDMDKIVLIGNHDHAWAQGEEVVSMDLCRTPQDYIEQWAQCSRARRFVQASAKTRVGRKKGLRVTRRTTAGTVVYVHGALVSRPDQIPELWGRVIDEYLTGQDLKGNLWKISPARVRANFREMRQNAYSVMIRGHDHSVFVFSLIDARGVEEFRQEARTEGQLEDGKRYILSVGDFKDGNYLLFDDETREFAFRNFDD